MNTVSPDELKSLVEAHKGPCVSILMPTQHMGAETRQNPIVFRKLLHAAEERLVAEGMHIHDAQAMLEPGRRLLEDSPFWQHQGEGLAVYLAPQLFKYYRLPMPLEPLALVAQRFHVKPLLRLMSGDSRFYVLALSQNKARLLEGTQSSIREVECKGMPEGLEQALDEVPEKQVQFRTMPGSRPGRSGQGAAIFYGQGAGMEDDKERITRYLHQVDDCLHQKLKSQRAPLVLAGVDYLFALYREVTLYPNLLPTPIAGNADVLSAEELRQRAWAIVQPLFKRNQQDAADYYRQLAGPVALPGTERTSANIEDVARAAHDCRVDTLFVATDRQVWGRFVPESEAVEVDAQPQKGSEDLLDFAAIHTLLNGGSVYAVPQQEVPADAPVAAVYRY
jgi:hypothetical protein